MDLCELFVFSGVILGTLAFVVAANWALMRVFELQYVIIAALKKAIMGTIRHLWTKYGPK